MFGATRIAQQLQASFMTQTTLLQYEAPCEHKYVSLVLIYSTSSSKGPVHSLDWCKSPAPGQQQRPRSSFRLGIASFTEDFRNRIAIVGLQDERVLIEDEYTEYPDFVTLCETQHGYPATSLQWQPASAANFAWSQKSPSTELLATTGDALRVWEYSSDGASTMSNFVGRQPTSGGHSLTLKTALSGVCINIVLSAPPPEL